MKKLIFDIDNTLIKWEDHYTNGLRKTMKEFNVDYDYKIIDKVIESQSTAHITLTKEKLLNDINNKTNLNLEINFVERLLENQKDAAIVDLEIIDTLKYLKEKYELVILTNYFIDTQIGRLKKAQIYDYFSDFIGGDQIKMKPHIESFQKAANGVPSIMIGDSVECDIDGAKKAGLDVIQIDYFNKYENTEHPLIRNISELKGLL